MCTHPGGTFSTPEFESLGQTLNILNDKIKSNPLPGMFIESDEKQLFYRIVYREECYITKLVFLSSLSPTLAIMSLHTS